MNCWKATVAALIVFLSITSRAEAQDVERFRPYPTVDEATKAGEGINVRERYPDLAFKDVDGKNLSLADFRGKIIVLHYWGSWCPPCVRELPQLVDLYNRFKNDERVAFVFLQAEEPMDVSLKFLKRKNMEIPTYESMISKKESRFNALYTLSDGRRIIREKLGTSYYPSTTFLDGNGIVIGHFRGFTNSNWLRWEAGIRDAAANAPSINASLK